MPRGHGGHCDPTRRERKVYLGDGAYAEFDGFGIVLTAENGIAVTDRVYLEPDVYRALTRFVKHFLDEDL